MPVTAGVFNPADGARSRKTQLYNLGNRSTHRDRRRADPVTGFLPSYRTRHGIIWQCAKCGERCDGPTMFCNFHLSSVTLRP